MSLRLFLAVPIPESIADRLLTLEADVPGASWRSAEQYHLTLRFIGDVNEAIARDIDTELGILGVAYFLCYYLLGQYVFQKVRLRLIISNRNKS